MSRTKAMVFISWTHIMCAQLPPISLEEKQLPWVTWKKLAQLLRCRFSKLLNSYTSRMDHNTQNTPPHEYHLTCEKTYQRGWDPGPANRDREYGEECWTAVTATTRTAEIDKMTKLNNWTNLCWRCYHRMMTWTMFSSMWHFELQETEDKK